MLRSIFIWCFLVYSSIYPIINCVDSDEKVSYRGYKLYQMTPRTTENLNFLEKLSEESASHIDFWKISKLINDTSDIMISPTINEPFKQLLDRNFIEYILITDDIESLLENERSTQQLTKSFLFTRPNSNFYLRYNEIIDYIHAVAKFYPKNVKINIIGHSYEQRAIPMITISSNINEQHKRSILIDAGIHAREWISPATALHVIEKLLDNLHADQSLMKKYNWIIIPILNPDGYEYTHTNDRLWRKTRSPNCKCFGTDINRNFDFHWGESGSSTNECDVTYQGSAPFTESEAIALKNVFENVTKNCDFYLTLHSYGNYLLYPWGYTSELPNTYEDLDKVATAGANAIKAYSGTIYKVGSSTNVLYAASGASDDYAFGVTGIPISITMELPSGGAHGFDPPSNQIKRIVEESWRGIEAMVLQVSKMDFKYRNVITQQTKIINKLY